MHKDATDKAASQEALKFFKYSFDKGGKMAEDLDYIPMPDPGQAGRDFLGVSDTRAKFGRTTIFVLSQPTRAGLSQRAPGHPGQSI